MGSVAIVFDRVVQRGDLLAEILLGCGRSLALERND